MSNNFNGHGPYIYIYIYIYNTIKATVTPSANLGPALI